jgi:methyl-accepting chemotaxis protein
MNGIQAFFARFSIAMRLRVGFAVVLGVLALVVVIAWGNLFATRQRVNVVINEIQPAVLASSALMNEIKEASTALGFYLLTQENSHRDAYDQHLKSIDGRLTELRDALGDDVDDDTRASLDAITGLVAQFRGYQARMLELATQQNQNYAALGYAAQNINPLSQELLQAVSTMIMTETEEAASARRKQLLLACEELRYAWANVMSNLRVYVVFGNADVYANMQLFVEGAGKHIKRIHEFKSLLSFEQEEALATVDGVYARFNDELKKLAQIFAGDQARMDAFMIRSEIGPLMRKIDEQVNALIDVQRTRAAETGDALEQQATAALWLMLLLLVVGLGVGAAVSWVITLMIAHPLKDAARAMQDIARGDGDLTRRLHAAGTDEIAMLSDAFNHFAGNIQDLIGQVQGATGQVAGAAGAMREVTERSCAALRQQKTASKEIVLSIQQMSAAAQNVAESAERTASAARDAADETATSRTTVGEALRAINSLAEETQATAGVIQRLGADMQSIGTVIDVIRGITEQTNLLALNAAIEAARAGEQGRGFAVVADEVRTLATRTHESTHQIQAKVESLQKDASEAVQRIMKNSDVARSTVELASKAGTSLDAITTAVSNINQMTAQIASAAEEQFTVVESVRGSIETIDRLTTHTDEAADKVTANVAELGKLSQQLNGLVARFRI